MSRTTGGGALVEMLRRYGVDTVFALPGVQNDALFVALYDAGEAVRVIHTRHEQGAAYMAYGYARSTGKVGAYAVVPGPGLLNTTAALSTAYATNTPPHGAFRGFGAPQSLFATERHMDRVAKAVGLMPASSATSMAFEEDTRKATKALNVETGAGFDRRYLDAQVKEQRAVLEALEDKLLPNANNADLKAYLTEVQVKAAARLRRTQALQRELDVKARAASVASGM